MNRVRQFWQDHRGGIRAILDQASLFVISLLLAVIVWIVATIESDPIIQRVFNTRVELHLVNLDPDMLLVNEVQSSARVTVRAPESTWSQLTTDNIIVQADLNHARAGEHIVPLTATLNLPGEVVNIEPSQIMVELDESAEKQVPVVVEVSGEVGIGYEAGTPQTDIAEATVYGPAKLVNRVNEAYAELALRGERAMVETTLPLVARGQGETVDNVRLEPDAVRVILPVAAREDFRTVSVLPNIQGRLPAGYIWQLESYSPETVVVTGPQNRLTTMAVPVLTEPISLEGQTESLEREVGLILPSGIQPATEDQKIVVRITIEAIEGFRQFDAIPVEVKGLTEGFHATFSPETVAVLISGPRITVSGLTEQDVRVVVDVTGLQPDTYQLNPVVLVAREGISQDRISVLPNVVEVQIVNPNATPTLSPTLSVTATPSP